MAGDTPSDEAVRAKAYELWEARGRPHDGGQDDWDKAKALLATAGLAEQSRLAEPPPQAEPAKPTEAVVPARPAEPHRTEEVASPVQAFADSILGVTTAAFDAATQMMEGIFGGASPSKPTDKPKPARPAEPAAGGEPLADAERRLQVEADARVQKAALDAAGTRKPEQP